MSDDTLLNEFSQAGDESAFSALVRRHVNLVYGTARRQVGDTGLAEEITQNVFIALARKSGALRGSATISGWLYRTTLLESRHALRYELRRQRRETAAFELGQVTRDGESPWSAIVPLLDEALTKLREGDRLAVLLRFLEQKPFREVGEALGISEDAAQKRVAKSLSELTAFFQRHGFRVSCAGAGGASLFAEASATAPVHLAASVSRAALATSSGAGLSGIGLVAFKIMNLTKLQTGIACVVLAAIPIGFEARALRSAQQDSRSLSARLTDAQEFLADAESNRGALAQRVRMAIPEAASQPAPPPRLNGLDGQLSPAWVDNSPFARVSKELLERVKVNALGRDWKIRPEVAGVLALSPDQTDRMQEAVDGFFAEIRALEESHLELVSAEPVAGADVNLETTPSTIILRINRYEPEANAARLRLREHLRNALGADRADLALRYLDLAPADRPAPEPGEPIPDGGYCELSGHTSGRWNFHGYERIITLKAPGRPGQEPELTVSVKFGSRDSMSFGGGEGLFNPATAPSLRTRWATAAASSRRRDQ